SLCVNPAQLFDLDLLRHPKTFRRTYGLAVGALSSYPHFCVRIFRLCPRLRLAFHFLWTMSRVDQLTPFFQDRKQNSEQEIARHQPRNPCVVPASKTVDRAIE